MWVHNSTTYNLSGEQVMKKVVAKIVILTLFEKYIIRYCLLLFFFSFFFFPSIDDRNSFHTLWDVISHKRNWRGTSWGGSRSHILVQILISCRLMRYVEKFNTIIFYWIIIELIYYILYYLKVNVLFEIMF